MLRVGSRLRLRTTLANRFVNGGHELLCPPFLYLGESFMEKHRCWYCDLQSFGREQLTKRIVDQQFSEIMKNNSKLDATLTRLFRNGVR